MLIWCRFHVDSCRFGIPYVDLCRFANLHESARCLHSCLHAVCALSAQSARCLHTVYRNLHVSLVFTPAASIELFPQSYMWLLTSSHAANPFDMHLKHLEYMGSPKIPSCIRI